MVDAFQALEIVFDYCGFDVVFGDESGFEEDGGDFGFAVVDGAVGVWFVAVGEANGFGGGGFGFGSDGLVDGHGLGALSNADHSGQIGVLAGDGDFTGKIVFGKSLNCAPGEAVVGGEDRGDVALGRVDGFEREEVGFGGQPIFGVGIGNDRDVAAIDVRLENFHLRVMKSFCTLVVGRAGD